MSSETLKERKREVRIQEPASRWIARNRWAVLSRPNPSIRCVRVNARTELAKRIFEEAHITGTFVLRSGEISYGKRLIARPTGGNPLSGFQGRRHSPENS